MANKKKNNKSLLGFLLFVFMMLSMIPIDASENQDDDILVLTRDKAVEMVIENSTELKKLEFGYNNLERQCIKASELSEQLEKTFNALESYEELYDKEQELLNSPVYKKQVDYEKAVSELEDLREQLTNPDITEEELAEIKAQISLKEAEVNFLRLTNEDKEELDELNLTFEEKAELKSYKVIFRPIYGSEPPHFSKQKKFESFVKNIEFPWYSLKKEMKKLNLTKDSVKKSIESGASMFLDGILLTDNKIKIQQELYDVQKKQYDQLIKKLEKGQAAKLDKIIAENNLKKLELSIENDKIDKENLEIQMKKMIGLNMDEEIMLELEENEIKQISELDIYIDKALENRVEIKNAEIDVGVKEREFKITDEYLDEDHMEWKEAKEALYEKEILLDKSKEQVKKDIKALYIDVINKREKLDLASKQLNKAKKELNAANINYEYGIIALDKLWLAELNKVNNEIQYDIAKISYNQAVNNLEKASDI